MAVANWATEPCSLFYEHDAAAFELRLQKACWQMSRALCDNRSSRKYFVMPNAACLAKLIMCNVQELYAAHSSKSRLAGCLSPGNAIPLACCLAAAAQLCEKPLPSLQACNAASIGNNSHRNCQDGVHSKQCMHACMCTSTQDHVAA